MTIELPRAARAATALLAFAALGACSNANLGDILGGVLGGGQQQGQAVEGTIRGVNNQQISLQQSNGQSVAIGYDNNTVVVFQNQRYAVTNLENGDRVVARVRDNNGQYYTDSIHVTQSVSGTGTGAGSASGNVQSFQGRVGQLDRQNGLFSVDIGNGTYTVALPYNVSANDQQRFQNLRAGDNVRFYGVQLNNSRIELRQFY